MTAPDETPRATLREDEQAVAEALSDVFSARVIDGRYITLHEADEFADALLASDWLRDERAAAHAAGVAQGRAEAGAALETAQQQAIALEAAVDRVRRRHPRGDEEGDLLAPGLWCPTCGGERRDNGYGGCDERTALVVPGSPLRAACIAEGAEQ